MKLEKGLRIGIADVVSRGGERRCPGRRGRGSLGMNQSGLRFLNQALSLGWFAGPLGLFLTMLFADLLLDFLGDEIDGGVEIVFRVLGVKIRTPDPEPNGTLELFFGRFGVVVFEAHPGIDSPAIKMLQFVNSAENVIFDGLGQFDIVGR
tara:strand:+ start:62 stop:511 length:450 start_codon:yes stop_codon:yes gene_type:complete